MALFPKSISLASLNGPNGFVLKGDDVDDLVGSSISATGDLNGDKYADIVIGAPDIGFGGGPGETYVVFGGARPASASIELAGLTGTNGFRIEGVADGDKNGISVSLAGDINGDGFDDLVTGAEGFGDDASGNNNAGASYVIFGRRSAWSASFDLTTLNGTIGFQLPGLDPFDESGRVASAGDVNGDNIADLLVTARNGDPNGQQNVGETYLVFGRTGAWNATFDLATLNGTNGVQFNGAAGSTSGYAVSSAGDLNGDGLSDIAIVGLGRSYVVFGRASGWPASLNLATLNGANGFTVDAGSNSAAAAAMADINGDGFADLVLSRPGADPNARNEAGSTYVIFGKASGWAPSLSVATLNGTNGFRVDGENPGDMSGSAVATGHLNGDRFADLVIGAPFSDVNGLANAGTTYVVFGRGSGWSAALDLRTLDGANGFALRGVTAGELSGSAVASGDIDHDGVDDLAIGAPGADLGQSDAGQVYVYYGQPGDPSANLNEVFRFFNTQNGDHFYTTSEVEKNHILANLKNLNYEGSQWATPDDGPDTIDVFRFYKNDGTHLYTTDVRERDHIIQNLKNYTYEGVAFEAYKGPGEPGAFALERFYNPKTGEHHLSASAAESAGLIAQGWGHSEGIAFYVHEPLIG